MRGPPITTEVHDTGRGLQCVVCGGAAESRVKIHLAGGDLRACSRCGTWVHFPRRDPSEQSEIHDTADYFEHPYFKLRRRLTEQQLRRCRRLFERLQGHIEIGELRGKKILDIGCDTGVFLSAAAKQFGIVPCGVDVNRRAVAMARDAGIEVHEGALEDAPAHFRDFPLITAIDLIEHVSDPRALLMEIRERLDTGGVAYIETPNIRSAVYRIGQGLAALTGGHPASLYDRLFPAQHIQYFTRGSLEWLARSCGLEVSGIGDRRLAAEDIAASRLIRAAMSAMQSIDSLTDERILLWAILRKPEAAG